MIVLVSGSRTWGSWDRIEARLAALPEDAIVVHGGAQGADHIVKKVCMAMGIPQRVFIAEWGKYGRRAGVLRNLEMLALEPDLVLAFWDGFSRGTRHVIHEAERRGLTLEIHRLGMP